MRFFQVVLSGAALIAAAWAVELNDYPTSIEPGKTYTITYSPKDNTPTTLKLRKGDPNNLDTIATITTTATGGSFQWTVDASLPNADDYALEIDQAGAQPNYSGLIKLTGSNAQESSSGSASPTATATAKETSTVGTTTVKATTVLTVTSASAGVSSTPGSNSTISTATLSRTGGSSSPTASTTGGSSPPESTGAASMLGSSPLALIFGAVAAMAYLN